MLSCGITARVRSLSVNFGMTLEVKEQLSWKKPSATRAVLSIYSLHIPTHFLKQFNCKVSNFIRKPSFHINPSEMIHWTISLLYISLKPLQSEHISIYFNIYFKYIDECQYISMCFNIFHYLSIYFFDDTSIRAHFTQTSSNFDLASQYCLLVQQCS